MYELVVRPSSDSEIATCVEAALCIERAVSVSLTSSNSAVTVPATVTVQANATAAQFTADISSVLTTASLGSSSMNVPLQLSAVILILSVNRTSGRLSRCGCEHLRERDP